MNGIGFYINATKKSDIKTFLLGGREHPAKRRSGQTLFVAQAGRERERNFPFVLRGKR